MTPIPADTDTFIATGVRAESGLLDPEIPALARARRRASDRRLADFGIEPAPAARAVLIHVAGADVMPRGPAGR